MQLIVGRIKDKDPGYFEIKLVPSHIDLEKAEEAESRGGFEAKHIIGNDFAGKEAKSGMSSHRIDWDEFAYVDDRLFLL